MSKIIDARHETTQLDIEEEIEKQHKLSPEVKNQIIKKVITNYIVAILILAYFLLMIIGNRYLNKDIFVLGCKISAFIMLVITVTVLEMAYKKDSGTITIYGIELLVVSIFSLFIPYAFYELNENIKKYFMAVGLVMAVYYVIKSIVVYRMQKKKYIKSLSDIGDIIKRDKKRVGAEATISHPSDKMKTIEKKGVSSQLKDAKKSKEAKKTKEVKKKIEKNIEITSMGATINQPKSKKEKSGRHMKTDNNQKKKNGRHVNKENDKEKIDKTVEILKNTIDSKKAIIDKIEVKELEAKKGKDIVNKIDKMRKAQSKKKEEQKPIEEPQYVVKKRGRPRKG